MNRLLQLTLILLGLVASSGHAQVGFDIELPEGNMITISSESVLFDVASQGFPPPEFPHYYLPVEPVEPLLVRIFSNIPGGWVFEADFAGGLVGPDGNVLPAGQFEYRFDGGPWFAFAPKVALYSSQGATLAFEEHTLELRLQLLGNEAPGRYRGALNFTLVQF